MNADGGMPGATGPSGTSGGTHQWRGVIEEYRDGSRSPMRPR